LRHRLKPAGKRTRFSHVSINLDRHFPRVGSDQAVAPVWCVTAPLGRCIHRYFDTSPISPSGRYVALTRVPFEDRPPAPGDRAEIVVVDLADGSSRIVATSCAWGMQLGAQAQWGATDQFLFFNDLTPGEWTPFGVRMDLSNNETLRLEGTVYSVARDGTKAASPSLVRTVRTQFGYGAVVPPDRVPRNSGAPDDDGAYVTDLSDGRCRLLASLRRIVEEAGLDGGDSPQSAFYGFHATWNNDGSRLMFVVRHKTGDGRGRRSHIVTMDGDGSNIRLALHWDDWKRGGHHANWHPDGEHITMNLKDENDVIRFVMFSHDGSDRATLGDDLVGSGHPSLHPNRRHLLSDAYGREKLGVAAPFNSPVRLIDLNTGYERRLFEFDGRPPGPNMRELRLDAHPAWSRDYRTIAFNGRSGGTRHVFLADVGGIVDP
jgi:hypothetical protein